MTKINVAEGSPWPDDPMNVVWFAIPDDLIGGWSIMPANVPPSSGCYEIACFISEEEARHITLLHNTWLWMKYMDGE